MFQPLSSRPVNKIVKMCLWQYMNMSRVWFWIHCWWFWCPSSLYNMLTYLGQIYRQFNNTFSKTHLTVVGLMRVMRFIAMLQNVNNTSDQQLCVSCDVPSVPAPKLQIVPKRESNLKCLQHPLYIGCRLQAVADLGFWKGEAENFFRGAAGAADYFREGGESEGGFGGVVLSVA